MIIYIFILLAFLIPKSVLAQVSNYQIICPNDPNSSTASAISCYKHSANTEPFFSHQNIYPGFISSPANLMTITNQDTDTPCFLTVSSHRQSGDELLFTGIHRLNLSITQNSTPNPTLWYSGPIEFSGQTLGQIEPGTSVNFNWVVSLPQDADNNYQNLRSVFDVDLNFVCAPNPDWQPPVTNPTSGVYLSEFMPQTPEGDEWVEIYNNNSFPVNLTNWKIKDDPTVSNPPKNFNALISAKSFFVINFDKGYLNDTGNDYVVLISDIGTTIESVSYSGSSTTTSWSKQSNGLWCQTLPSKKLANHPCLNTTPTPITTLTPTLTPTPILSTNGQIQGASTSPTASSPSAPPGCNDPVPGTPELLSATAGGGNVTLTWTAVSPVTSYLIAYGPSVDKFLYGNPNIGLSTTYTVGGLTPGARYCFYVRGQNGCMPGARSNVICVNTGSNVPIVETEPPVGFQPEILGEITDNIEKNQVTSEEDLNLTDILGDSISSCQTLYIPILFVLAFILNSLIFYKNSQSNLFLPFLISLTTFVIDYFLLQKFCCRISFLCRFYYIGNIISFILPKLIFRQKSSS